MQVLGQFLVLASLLFTGFVAALAGAGALARRHRPVRAALDGVRAVAWLNVAASLILLHAMLTHDFANRYVAAYSDTTMPAFYLITAFWAGEKGALLFWVLMLSLLMIALIRSRPDDTSPKFGATVSVLALAVLFFEVLMVFASHPFETFLTSEGPADGNGMNPLLQNPLMAIHPPFQLAGFVAYTIPFAFSVSALITGDLDDSWIRESRRWNLLAWTLLTAGLIIGGLWAYVELGWGGFWGWDPVENAALLPWLSGTALLHSTTVEVRRGMLRRWNHFLTALTFVLTIFATFLTRSQLIASLHAFSNSVLTPFFVDYLVILCAVSAGLLAWRWRALAPRDRIRSLWSREALVVLNNLAFLLALFIVLWGTLLPKFSESPDVQATINAAIALWNSWTGAEMPALNSAITVGPDWFNRVVAPVGLLILLLTALGPLVPFRDGARATVNRAVRRTAVLAVLIAGAVVAGAVMVRASHAADALGVPWSQAVSSIVRRASMQHAYGALAVLFASWVIGVAVYDYARSVAVRRAVTARSRFSTVRSLLRDNPRRYGGHAIHLGVALCFLGFAGSAVREERKDVVVQPGDRVAIGSQDLVFLGTHEAFDERGGYAAARSEFAVWPRGRAVPESAMQALRQVDRVVAVEQAAAPEVALRFGSPEEARRFYATEVTKTQLRRDFQVARVLRERREIHLAPAEPLTLNVVPRAFHRLAEELRALSTALGEDRVKVQTRRGDPLIVLVVPEDSLFEAFLAGWSSRDPSPLLFAALDPAAPERVRVIPAGAPQVLRPEMRFYPKFESPTTEVDIEAGLLYDLYVAAAPGTGTRSASLTAMVNPLMTWVWAGAVMLIGFGFVLAIGWPARARPLPEVAGGARVGESLESKGALSR